MRADEARAHIDAIQRAKDDEAAVVAMGIAVMRLLADAADRDEAESRRAPVQGKPRERAPGTISWREHLEAYASYAAQFGTSQSAERLAERGGFGYEELTNLLGHEPTTWVPVGAR